jgi:hypothetical protein
MNAHTRILSTRSIARPPLVGWLVSLVALVPALASRIALDNFGNRYTGRARIGGTLEAINPLSAAAAAMP